MGGMTGFRSGRRRTRRSLTEITPREPLTMRTPVGLFRQPIGERGSVTNPLGPRSRRRAYWQPADADARAFVAAHS